MSDAQRPSGERAPDAFANITVQSDPVQNNLVVTDTPKIVTDSPPEEFIRIMPVPVPVAGAGLPGIALTSLALAWLRRRKKLRSTPSHVLRAPRTGSRTWLP
jgi:hypothetical protein